LEQQESVVFGMNIVRYSGGFGIVGKGLQGIDLIAKSFKKNV